MVRRVMLALGSAALVLAMSGATVMAGNPSGRGQPGAECGDEGAEMEPAGFGSPGFEIAEARYAGSDETASLMHANSDRAVSQYDVACYQITQHH